GTACHRARLPGTCRAECARARHDHRRAKSRALAARPAHHVGPAQRALALPGAALSLGRRTRRALSWPGSAIVRALRLDLVEIVALWLIAAIVVAGAVFGSRLALYNLTIIALFATVAISLNLLLGLAGQASFAQTTFMAL